MPPTGALGVSPGGVLKAKAEKNEALEPACVEPSLAASQ